MLHKCWEAITLTLGTWQWDSLRPEPLSTACLLGATGCGGPAIIWEMAPFPKCAVNCEEDRYDGS